MIIGGGVGALLACGLVWWVTQRAAANRRQPAWTDGEQPPEGTAGEPTAGPILPTVAASWGAARPPHPGMRGGARVIRSYAPTLVDDPESVVR